ncbi:MAG: 4-hydroxy-tetrahydrodipicolinate reductase [Clostridia bacterium]
MVKIIICGIGGKMGHTVLESLKEEKNAVAVGGIDKFADQSSFNIPIFKSAKEINVPFDVIIDFSRPDALNDLLECAEKCHTKLVIATTGYSQEQLDQIKSASDKIAIFKTTNLSLGINLMTSLCRKAVALLGDNFDVEIIEQHHNLKVDAPSGTALSIAKAINEEFDNQKEFVYGRHCANERRSKKEIGIHAIRGGTIVGKHSVEFIGNDEIVTISHEAQSKAVFAQGAIKAAIFMQDKQNGMHNMEELVQAMLGNE